MWEDKLFWISSGVNVIALEFIVQGFPKIETGFGVVVWHILFEFEYSENATLLEFCSKPKFGMYTYLYQSDCHIHMNIT